MADGANTEKARKPGLGPPWQPGQSGNPSGRPKGVSLTAAIMRVLSEEDANRLVRAIIRKAKRGDVRAFEQLIERTDGKVPTQIGGIIDDDGQQPIPLRIIKE